MKKGLTELVFIIDLSGSVERIAVVEVEAVVTTVIFDDKYEFHHDRIGIKAIVALTDKDYIVRGCTAILDAIGRTINKIRTAQKHTAENSHAEKALFTIITGGA